MSALVVEHLWKQYRFGRLSYGTLRRDLQSWWARIAKRDDPNQKIESNREDQAKEREGDRFWALRDVSLAVEPGEVVGIIGRNGAGKSTLLKVVSRVTSPTKGSVRVRGRLASLLEVGTGFHPDLTGRENVFLNGTILGMSRREIGRRFDEIVEFAEVGRFIDTPVKRYSSGMYVRLAFAVAAHLTPDILVVDEVLAVGDAAFQRKCLGRMSEVANQGRTVLFVSHNLASVEALCTRAIVMEAGEVVASGSVEEATARYRRSTAMEQDGAAGGVRRRIAEPRCVRVDRVRLDGWGGGGAPLLPVWGGMKVRVDVTVMDSDRPFSAFVLIWSEDGTVAWSAFEYDLSEARREEAGPHTVILEIPELGLRPGRYRLDAGIFGRFNEFFDWLEGAAVVDVASGFADGRPFDHRLGCTLARMRFRRD